MNGAKLQYLILKSGCARPDIIPHLDSIGTSRIMLGGWIWGAAFALMGWWTVTRAPAKA
jgi:hypothetical protein